MMPDTFRDSHTSKPESAPGWERKAMDYVTTGLGAAEKTITEHPYLCLAAVGAAAVAIGVTRTGRIASAFDSSAAATEKALLPELTLTARSKVAEHQILEKFITPLGGAPIDGEAALDQELFGAHRAFIPPNKIGPNIQELLSSAPRSLPSLKDIEFAQPRGTIGLPAHGLTIAWGGPPTESEMNALRKLVAVGSKMPKS